MKAKKTIGKILLILFIISTALTALYFNEVNPYRKCWDNANEFYYYYNVLEARAKGPTYYEDCSDDIVEHKVRYVARIFMKEFLESHPKVESVWIGADTAFSHKTYITVDGKKYWLYYWEYNEEYSEIEDIIDDVALTAWNHIKNNLYIFLAVDLALLIAFLMLRNATYTIGMLLTIVASLSPIVLLNRVDFDSFSTYEGIITGPLVIPLMVCIFGMLFMRGNYKRKTTGLLLYLLTIVCALTWQNKDIVDTLVYILWMSFDKITSIAIYTYIAMLSVPYIIIRQISIWLINRKNLYGEKAN